MTLKVGEVYRGMFAGEPRWLVIEKIEALDGGKVIIRFLGFEKSIPPRWLWRWWGAEYKDSAEDFIKRLDKVKNMPESRSVSEVEVNDR